MAVSGSTKSWARLDPQPHKVPAWKLEVLERKRAKMASAAGSRGKDSSPSRKSRSPSRQGGSPERLVLQDSLGPLHENPFIKQEKERRRHHHPRRPQQQPPSPGRATSPIRHLLDMYSHVPGMRTIRAENIIIIESDPGYFSHGGGDPVEELLAKRGSKVAEIRASEVVIYEPEVPNSQQPKKTPEPESPPEHAEVLEEAGRVSRLLEKFDHGHSRPVRSRSLENLLDRDSKPVLMPKPANLERPGQARSPKRSGELSPSFSLEEDGKRFPVNNTSWLPSPPNLEHPVGRSPKRSGELSPSGLEKDGKRLPPNNPSWVPSPPNLERPVSRSPKRSGELSPSGLEEDGKRFPLNNPSWLPSPPNLERPGQVLITRSPKRSGELSPSSASILEEDSKRFPLNNPSWLPSKAPISPSLPDPDLFHKRPSSPGSAAVTPLSPSSPLSPVSPIVAAVKGKFEAGLSHPSNNIPPLPKLVNVTQKVGGNTILVNPKAAPAGKVSSANSDGDRDCVPLTNGHVENAKAGGSVSIQDLLSKSKRPKGTAAPRVPEGSGPVPSNEIPNAWRPKSEADPANNVPPKSSATYSENPSIDHCDPASATPTQRLRVSASTSSNDSFEIRPAPKPDLASIPDDDIQAKALANIRMQSKNSFVFIPKKRQVPCVAQEDGPVPSNAKPKNGASTLNGPKVDSTDSPRQNGVRADRVREQDAEGDVGKTVSSETLRTASAPTLSDFDWRSGLLPSKSSTQGQSFTDLGAELEYFSSVQQGDGGDVAPNVPVTKIPEDVVKPDIPVTNIDDIVNTEEKESRPALKVVEAAPRRPHAVVAPIRSKGGNTFTVVPKRKPVTEQEAFRTPLVEEEEEEDPRSKRKSSDGSEAPYSELGALLKKRYPTAEEIQVIGGYQSLSKSCLSKIGSTRKKMKISFNEQNIHTMFEYPSETSVADEIGEDEASGSDSEEDDKPSGLFLPRPKFVSSGGAGNSLRANSATSGLSNYTPKHSVEFSRWQDEASVGGTTSPDLSAPSADMLTPADSYSHTGFRSEPALYF